jgi:hypothetical protein
MNLETVIAEKVHALPTVKQKKVLAFVEDLEHESVESPDKPEKTEEEKRQGRLALIGIGKSGRSDLSERVDEILAEGANKQEGWSMP